MAEDFNSSLLRTGAERLALLGKHAQALMQGYIGEQVDESAFSDAALKKLLAARILWRPDEDSGLKLSHRVRDLIAEMLSDARRRHVNADVAETLELLRNLVMTWREAQQRGDYLLAEQQQVRLTQEVDDLNSRFADAIDSLWQRLNSDFGFVSSLNDKIRENERAQKQISRLLDGLDLIDFDELITLVGGSGPLRKLLVSQLQNQVSAHYSNLREVQSRLLQLMARFRQQQSRNLLVNGMVGFLREHPRFRPGNYAQRTEVPTLFNQAAGLVPAAAAALDRDRDADLLAELLQHLPRRDLQAENLLVAAPAQWSAEAASVAARQQQLKEDVEAYYLQVVDAGQPLSALDYLQSSGLAWDAEIWLFQVIAEYQGLPARQQQQFRIWQDESPTSPWNQVRLIHDVQLQLAPVAQVAS
ncbi:hypothetical protein [Marinospirillum alkaliphilum]|uniref:Uncharacterized protein n=1 Tax=Marinospirillum alkaliphilum DSM 21637 TaxID=1122209 RepID=A0A1K1YWL0_9GAMM|nr:hypothetical protein [Marinospirillum alkaliphilum]SFX66337.1 hypothetical protein SAMN02745752_02436 [Marinospirillum alkaliphilum DSM 21637]